MKSTCVYTLLLVFLGVIHGGEGVASSVKSSKHGSLKGKNKAGSEVGRMKKVGSDLRENTPKVESKQDSNHDSRLPEVGSDQVNSVGKQMDEKQLEEDEDNEGEGQGELDPRIRQLRSRGIEYIGLKKYYPAARCYTAALQLMETCGGDVARDLRRRCSLTLGECFIKCGRYQAAIARCTEVIDEAPEVDVLVQGLYSDAEGGNIDHRSSSGGSSSSSISDSVRSSVSSSSSRSSSSSSSSRSSSSSSSNIEEGSDTGGRGQLVTALSRAFQRRGISLQRVGRPDLGLMDLRHANALRPGNEAVLRAIERLEETTAAATDEDESIEDLREQLQDLLEQTQLDHPPEELSAGEISRLLTRSPTKDMGSMSLSSSARSSPSALASPQAGFEALMNGVTGGAGVGSASPLGDMMGMLGGLGGSMEAGGGSRQASGLGESIKKVTGLLPMIGSMLGMDTTTVTNVKEICHAFVDVGSMAAGALSVLQRHSSEVAMVVTLLWAFVTVYMK